MYILIQLCYTVAIRTLSNKFCSKNTNSGGLIIEIETDQVSDKTVSCLYFSCVSCPVFLCCLFYVFVSRQLINSQIQAMNTLNSSFLTQVDSELRDLDNVSVNINYSNISKNILDKSFDLNISSDMLEEMTDLFIALSGTEWKADQMNLYDTSGHVLQSGLTTMVRNVDSSQLEWMEHAQELEGSKIITKPYVTDKYSKSAKYKQWFISLYRSFNNQYGRSVGVIETVKQCKSIFKSIISYEKRIKIILLRFIF